MNIRNWWSKKQEKRKGSVLSTLSYGTLGGNLAFTQQMTLSAVYRCNEVISDSVASLPFEPIKRKENGFTMVDYNHGIYNTLNLEPNKIQSRYIFMKTLVSNMLLKGNGYGLIRRDGNGNVKSIELVDPTAVTIYISQDKKELSYSVLGEVANIPAYNMIHIPNFTYDGINGVSTLTHALLTTETAMAAEKHAKGFFAGGANVSGILQVKSGLDDGQAAEIQAKWKTALSSDTGNPNGIIVMEGEDMEFKPVSINPADAQMLESRRFSVIDICRFFGVSPIKAFDLTSTGYNSIEQSNLAFLTDTLTPILEKIENEYNRKVFRPSERKTMQTQFNLESLMRGDMKTQSEYYSKLFNIGVFTSNDIRGKLNMEPIDGGDKAFVQGALLPIDYDFSQKEQKDNKTKAVIKNEDDEEEPTS